MAGAEVMERFGEATRRWFAQTFAEPTEVQRRGWSEIASGRHTLLLAPTGSGKTLAAFLYALDRLFRELREEQKGGQEGEREPGVRVLYISPLKALAYDIERNLRSPRIGILGAQRHLGEGADPGLAPEVFVRTGDTSPKERNRFQKEPAEILVTTPESLYLILGSQARETLRTVHTVILDEVHALAPTKRGAHLSLSLERLSEITHTEPQRIGLSATATPASEVARYLGGDREVRIVDASTPPHLSISIVVPLEDMSRPGKGQEVIGPDGELDPEASRSVWPAIYPKLLEEIRAHRTTIVFVNSRGLAERMCRRLNELAEEELALAHHGSIAHEQRRTIEEALKEGRIKAIVATSSLELGIDMGSVDLVLMIESPGAVHRGLQRIGRAGHQVGERSVGKLFPKHRGDLLESAVVARRMMDGAIEALALPQNPLDILAQQVVAAVATEDQEVASLGAWVRRAAPFSELPEDALLGVLDMLSGRYPSSDFADLRPRIVWDREAGILTPRKGAKMLSLISGGTIPDRGLYAVHLGADGPRVGELDEEMVHESSAGETFMLGASTWKIEEITRDRVVVRPAPGELGKLPFWHGDGPGRPVELGRAIGAFIRRIEELPKAEALAFLRKEHRLDALAADNLYAYIAEQKEETGTLPTDRALTVERFRDELGDQRICILSPFGARVHAPWALAIRASLARQSGFETQSMWSDDGIVLTIADGDEAPDLDLLFPDPEELEELLLEELGASSLFAARFRENAARALLLPRRRPGSRTPLWAQRLRAQRLLGVARQFPSFPIVIETYRQCLKEIFDLPALGEILSAIGEQRLRIDEVELLSPSPFSRSLVFAYVAAYLYEGDSPLAERKAQALSLDRRLLRELLGQEELRELLDPEVIAALEAELQHRADGRRARDEEDLADLFRRLGDLSEAELKERSEEDPGPWIASLSRSRRIARLHLGGEARWIAIEDVALYRDALGAAPPPGVPLSLLDPHPEALLDLVLRFARTRGPFPPSALADRYGLPAAQIALALSTLEARGKLVRGGLGSLGGASGREELWCEAEVLRRIKRRTLARLRNEVAPVEARTLARFLPAWHGVRALPSPRQQEESFGFARQKKGKRKSEKKSEEDKRSEGRGGRELEEVVAQLEGLPLPLSDLETAILPARVRGYAPRMLDELGARGGVVWVGHGALGKSDGRIALYRRSQIAKLWSPPPPPEDLSELEGRVLTSLEERGASFFLELREEAGEGASLREVLAALLHLSYLGLVTNDTLEALRQLRTALATRGSKAETSRGRRRGPILPGGRWSLTQSLVRREVSPTEEAHARALALLGRHGVLSREAMALEPIEGGFSAIYRVLKAMEEAGKIRRGHFAAGLGGAQFAFPGAVDRMRGMREQEERGERVLLSAVDPANPYGWLLPWPELRGEGAGPRRVAGAWVLLLDGEAALYLDHGGKRLRTFEGVERGPLREALGALQEVAKRKRRRSLRLEKVDGEAARSASLSPLLREVGFRDDPRGLVLEA